VNTNPSSQVPPPLPSNAINFSERDLQYVESRDADEAYGEIRVLKLLN